MQIIDNSLIGPKKSPANPTRSPSAMSKQEKKKREKDKKIIPKRKRTESRRSKHTIRVQHGPLLIDEVVVEH